jgi:hypothetical protein
MAANPQARAPEAASTVDASNPWLGLASFTEETRAFFFGREAEIAELGRRVQRKLLTVLFGQSGLGKTSILRAGLVPRLRRQGYCPVYVRIDYAPGTPEPAEQIKQAIRLTARLSGEWTQAGVAVAGEPLWAFLHHRDDVLRDEAGERLIPLLIFDQFEELFTLAQSDEFGRNRAAGFIGELADLVENRAPRSLEAKFEEDESAAARFDFARSDYRVLIALREDYLAPLESLKAAMPSVSQNRLRLAPMNGEQALAAVLGPGKGLVSEEVAEAIVRFVAGGAELANAEVEPSLLSLICRELNDARLEQGRREISLDLLAGSHSSILSNFYERALADQPPGVRRVIEDDLLTSSGFRENVAEERLLSRLNEAGAAPGTLALLVNRRLLRIEERLDLRRVELTHDVLCQVVKASRDARQEREARDAAERRLAEQHARELAARRALVRARQVAAVCTVLALLAIAAAVLAYFSERHAQRTQAVAEQARSQSERLLAYLADDFARELEVTGRLEALADFSKRQIDYFHALPAALKSPDSIRNAALALTHHARALRTLGDLDQGGRDAAEAIQLLEELRRGGDTSEATTRALAAACLARAQILDNRNDPQSLPLAERALALLKPLAEAPGASGAARRDYVSILTRLGFMQQKAREYEQAVRTENEAREIAAALGARDLTDLDMGAYYAEATAWLVTALYSTGQQALARTQAEDSFALCTRVLGRRPGHRVALHAQEILGSYLAGFALEDLDPLLSAQLSVRNEAISQTMLDLDPDNVVTLNNLGGNSVSAANAFWLAGHLQEAVRYNAKASEVTGRAAAHESSGDFLETHLLFTGFLALNQTMMGDAQGAAATLAKIRAIDVRLRKSDPAGSVGSVMGDVWQKAIAVQAGLLHGEFAATQRLARETLSEIAPATPRSGDESFGQALTVAALNHLLAIANYELGEFAAAEAAEELSLKSRKEFAAPGVSTDRDLGESSTWLAMAQAREGKLTAAAATLAPVLKMQRDLRARNKSDAWLPMELARALYAQSLIEPARAPALLKEAAQLLEGLTPAVRQLPEPQLWRARIARGPGHP